MKELSDINFEGYKKHWHNLIDSDYNMHLTVGLLINMRNNIYIYRERESNHGEKNYILENIFDSRL